MLIARIYPLMTVYTVKGGQRKGSKHVINFPQNVSRLAAVLPQIPGDVPLIVRRSNLNEDQHYDFRVRRWKVERALRWLKANNKWYRDITISDEHLMQLPLDDNLERVFVRQVEDLNLPNGDLGMADAPPGAASQNEGNNDDNMGTFYLCVLIGQTMLRTLRRRFMLVCLLSFFGNERKTKRSNAFFGN